MYACTGHHYRKISWGVGGGNNFLLIKAAEFCLISPSPQIWQEDGVSPPLPKGHPATAAPQTQKNLFLVPVLVIQRLSASSRKVKSLKAWGGGFAFSCLPPCQEGGERERHSRLGPHKYGENSCVKFNGADL
uniref:Uncharacterized protein n=1 Tax=Micrurus spixii TaxID=129469 RepID=A0A2D4N6R8_9SAUR